MKNYEVSNMEDVCQSCREDMACYDLTGIGVTASVLALTVGQSGHAVDGKVPPVDTTLA
jgi:hypothetical protein